MNAFQRTAGPIVIGTREQILNRVFEILQTIPPYQPLPPSPNPPTPTPLPVFRNRGGIEDISRPAIVLLDGGERNVSTEQETLGVVRLPPAILIMSPQIFVLLKERDTEMNDSVASVYNPVGAELNYWVDAIRGALANDAQLRELLTRNGQVIYRGCWTDMMTGSTMLGELRLFIDLVYVWLPPQ